MIIGNNEKEFHKRLDVNVLQKKTHFLRALCCAIKEITLKMFSVYIHFRGALRKPFFFYQITRRESRISNKEQL